MKTFDARAYSIADFEEWHLERKLILSPKFQRRSVWSGRAKAFLADTIIRGKPFPKVIIMQKYVAGKTVRVVVDGQQRLRSILEFLDDGIKISRAHNRELAGKVFSELPEDIQEQFRSYEVGCDVLGDSPTSELLDIFARINRYSIKLNAQELRNANYSGHFKTTAFSVGYEYVDYWQEARVLSQTSVNRMGEAELASDLLVAFLEQIQSNKAIERVYRDFEEVEDGIDDAAENLRAAINIAAKLLPDDELKQSPWRKRHLYYSLVTSVGQILGTVDSEVPIGVSEDVLEKPGKLRAVLNAIGADHDEFTPQPMRALAPGRLTDFIRNSTLATTDTKARIERNKYILGVIEAEFGN